MKTLNELKSDEGFIQYLAKSTERTTEDVIAGITNDTKVDMNSEYQMYELKAKKIAVAATSGNGKIVVAVVKRVQLYEEGLVVYNNSERDKVEGEKDIKNSQLMFGYIIVSIGKEEVALYQTARQLNRLGQISGIMLDNAPELVEHNNKDIAVNINQWNNLKTICSGSDTDIGVATADVKVTKRVAGDTYELKDGKTGTYTVTKPHYEIVQINKNYGLVNMMAGHLQTARVAATAKAELAQNSIFGS